MRLPSIYSYLKLSDTLAPNCQGQLTQSHLKAKVTVRQFSGYRKIKSVYVKTMLLFKVIGAWQPCETGMAPKDMQLLG